MWYLRTVPSGTARTATLAADPATLSAAATLSTNPANVSATMFTVVGIMCKIGTVVINQVIWDKHASANGLAALLVCLLAGTFYKQAPRRGERAGGK